jgi:hypothetical protein
MCDVTSAARNTGHTATTAAKKTNVSQLQRRTMDEFLALIAT